MRFLRKRLGYGWDGVNIKYEKYGSYAEYAEYAKYAKYAECAKYA